MNIGQRIVSAAVRELGLSVGRGGDLDSACALLGELPWLVDLDVELIDGMLDQAASDARILSPTAVMARADLVLGAVQDRGADLELAAAMGAIRVAAALDDAERVIVYAALALELATSADAPERSLAECHEQRGRAFAVLGDAAQAATSFADAAGAAAKAGASDIEARALCELAAGLLADDNPLAAIDMATRAADRASVGGHDATLARAHGLRGAAHLRLHRLAAAQQALGEAVEVARRAGDRQAESDWLGNLGIVALEEERWDDAVECHLQALALSREIGNVGSELADLGNLAATFARAGRAEESLDPLVMAVRVAENGSDQALLTSVRRQLRQAYVAAGHYEEAVALEELESSRPEEEIGVAGTTAPDDDAEEFLAALTNLRRSGADVETARALVDEFIARRPDSYAGPMGSGIILRDQDRFDEAIAAYERALELDPSRVDVLNNLLAAAGAGGLLDDQEVRWRATVDANPFDPLARFALGCIHNMRGQPDLALRELRESLRLGESSGLARLILCAALVAKGKSLIEHGPRFDLQRWSAAWGYFEECIGEALQLTSQQPAPASGTVNGAADLLVDLAMTSNAANGPMFEPIGDRELETLAYAGRLLQRAEELEPGSRAVELRSNRLYGLVQGFGEDALRSFLTTLVGLPRGP